MFIYQSIVILRPPRPHTGHAQLLAEESLKNFLKLPTIIAQIFHIANIAGGF